MASDDGTSEEGDAGESALSFSVVEVCEWLVCVEECSQYSWRF